MVTGPHGLPEEVWLFETDPSMVEEEALRHVQNLFPQPLGWRPAGDERGDFPRWLCMCRGQGGPARTGGDSTRCGESGLFESAATHDD